MNAKQCKRIRKSLEAALLASGYPAAAYDRMLVAYMVPSQRMSVSIPRELSHDFPSLVDWGMPVQVISNAALRWVNTPDCPRGIYRRIKKRVQAHRSQERAGVLRELRGRIAERVAALQQHARAEGIQREYEAVRDMQGVGVSQPPEGT